MAERKNSKKIEEENLWNNVLSESLTSNKFSNSNILILGDRASGKRALLNALQEHSETEIPTKSFLSLIFLNFWNFYHRRK